MQIKAIGMQFEATNNGITHTYQRKVDFIVGLYK